MLVVLDVDGRNSFVLFLTVKLFRTRPDLSPVQTALNLEPATSIDGATGFRRKLNFL